LAAWLDHSLTVRGVSRSTARAYESIANTALQRLGGVDPHRDIVERRLRESSKRDAREGKARATVHHHLTALRHAFDLAVGDGWLAADPSDGLSIVPLPKVEPDFNVLEPSQVEAVAATMPVP
jgi:site-specific recombinase XerD